MATRGKPAHFRLAKVCEILNMTEGQLVSALGLSRAALKSVERQEVPLYLQLALTAMMDGVQPSPLFQKTGYEFKSTTRRMELRLVR
ncbi:hypothetical protein HED63_20750 [Ochrobactrum cytisi]|uniref:hypothetical protein n=1 Tax=Brucella cytisi TaxID=407152 RepID=UPI0016A45A46|nr:hypothetical protein [Brucella cytisi]